MAKFVLKKDIIFKAGTVVDTEISETQHAGKMAVASKAMGRNATMTLIIPLEDCQPLRYIKVKEGK